MKMDRGAARPNLYPDLSEFYTQSAPDSASSPPAHPPQRLQPTAPPLQETRHDLHPGEDRIPEEPEEDYLLDEVSVLGEGVSRGGDPHSMANHSTTRCPWGEDIGELTVDYSLGDITVDYSLDEVSLENLLELEPDYDDADDLPRDSQRLSQHLNHHLNYNHLNNLNLLTASAKKTLREKNIEVPEPPRDDQDFGAWVKWRMQTNKLLAALVLSRRGQRRVLLRESELRRKPLTRHNVEKVVQQARGGGGAGARRRASPAERTSLPACPYVMYGIPRVTLPHAAASQP